MHKGHLTFHANCCCFLLLQLLYILTVNEIQFARSWFNEAQTVTNFRLTVQFSVVTCS